MRITFKTRQRFFAAVAAVGSLHSVEFSAAQNGVPYGVPQGPPASVSYGGTAGPVYSYQQTPAMAPSAPMAAYVGTTNYPTVASQNVIFGAPQGPQRNSGSQAYQVPTGAPVEVAWAQQNGGVPCTQGCNEGQPVSSGSACNSPAESYSAGGCATGGCGGTDYTSFGANGYGGCGGYNTYGCGIAGGLGNRLGMGGGCGGGCGGNMWFGGIYGLLMEVNQSSYVPLAFAASGLAVGDYPTRSDFVLFADDAEPGFQGGFEARLGRTFGSSYDSCGGSFGPRLGLEGVYWQLFEDSDTATYTDQVGLRTYGMSDFRGIEFNPGAAYRPANHYQDYAPPVADYTVGGLDLIELRAARVRRSYELINVELNLLKFSLCGGGSPFMSVGPAACGGSYGGGLNGSCGSGGCSTGSCGPGGCAMNSGGYAVRGQNCCGSRFSCTGVCGIRYLQIDERFLTGYDWENVTTPATGYIDRHINVDNNLVGFQTGCNGLYRLGCRWGVQLNSLLGVYGNDIDVHHYFNASGQTRFIGTQEAADVRASKTDVSILGELRLGLNYQATNNCRVYGGWRVLGLSGVGLATDQIPQAYTDAAALRWIDSDGSLIVHGLQTGLEWNY